MGVSPLNGMNAAHGWNVLFCHLSSIIKSSSSQRRRPYPDLSGSVLSNPWARILHCPSFFYFALLDRQSAWIGKTCPDIFIKLLFPHPLLVARVCWTLAPQVKKVQGKSPQINIKSINILRKPLVLLANHQNSPKSVVFRMDGHGVRTDADTPKQYLPKVTCRWRRCISPPPLGVSCIWRPQLFGINCPFSLCRKM